MRKIWNGILEAIFPENCCCIFCGKEALVGQSGVCEECAAAVRRALPPSAVFPLDAAGAVFAYSERSSRPVKRLKYGGERWLARPLAQFLSPPDDWAAELILPVPLHPARQRSRGFNQSALLAKGMSVRCGIPMAENLLLRVKNTHSQAELERKTRLTNLNGAFVCPDPDSIRSRSILLVDDVITTGSTMAECARTLKAAGASRVYGLALCYQADSVDAESPLYFR